MGRWVVVAPTSRQLKPSIYCVSYFNASSVAMVRATVAQTIGLMSITRLAGFFVPRLLPPFT